MARPDANNNSFEDRVSAVMQEEAATSSLSSNYVPSHVHNNSDSPSIPFLNLTNKQFIVKESIQGTAAATSGNYGVFFAAPFQCSVMGVVYTFQVASTSGLVQIEHLYQGIASGSGTPILTTPLSLSTIANTVYGGALVQSSITTLGRGDRLGLVVSGTLTSQSQVVIELLMSY